MLEASGALEGAGGDGDNDSDDDDEEDGDGEADGDGDGEAEEGGSGGADAGGKKSDRKAAKASLAKLQSVLEGIYDAEQLPGEIRAEAASVVDHSLPLFYPSTEERTALLKRCTADGTDGVVELQLAWPVEVAGGAAGGNDGGDDEEDGPAATGGAAGGGDSTDSRFERAVLLVQSACRRSGWRCEILSLWKQSIHLVLSPPRRTSATSAGPSGAAPGNNAASGNNDGSVGPVEELLTKTLAEELDRAGIAGFVFPEGCQLDDLGFCLERSLNFDR